jgi:hypothetical protein
MNTTSRTVAAIGLATICAAGLSAQTQETKTTTTTKVEMKGGKNVTAIGCLERRENGDYILTGVRADHAVDPSRYALVTDDDLSKQVGQRVRIQGKAVTAGNGKVSVRSETKTEVENGKDLDTKSKTEGTTGTIDMPYLGVKSMKTVSMSCY